MVRPLVLLGRHQLTGLPVPSDSRYSAVWVLTSSNPRSMFIYLITCASLLHIHVCSSLSLWLPSTVHTCSHVTVLPSIVHTARDKAARGRLQETNTLTQNKQTDAVWAGSLQHTEYAAYTQQTNTQAQNKHNVCGYTAQLTL